MLNNSQVIKFDEPSGTQLLSHVLDISGMQFFEQGPPVWLQALPLGTYEHPVYGKIEVTSEKVQQFVDNFKNNVREIELDVDYDHKALTTEAAGWIKAAEDRGSQGLWIAVQFLPKALQQLKDKAYKYFSSEFVDEWKHPKTGQVFKNVLFGGAITNRPFIKDILPINLSELIIQPEVTLQLGDQMDPKLKANLIKLYKLNEDATDEEVLTAVSEEADLPDEEEVDDDETEDEDEDEVQLSELAKSNPRLAKILADQKAMSDRMVQLELATKLSETTVKLNALNEQGKYAIPPAVLTEARDVIVTLNDSQGAKVLQILENFTKLGLVELGERGRNEPGRDNKTGSELFIAEVTKLAEERKITFADASLIVSAADPALFDAYRQDSTNRN